MKCKQLTGKLFTTVYDKGRACMRVRACMYACVCVCVCVRREGGGSSSSTGKVLCCNVSVIIIKQHRGLWVWALTGGEHV